MQIILKGKKKTPSKTKSSLLYFCDTCYLGNTAMVWYDFLFGLKHFPFCILSVPGAEKDTQLKMQKVGLLMTRTKLWETHLKILWLPCVLKVGNTSDSSRSLTALEQQLDSYIYLGEPTLSTGSGSPRHPLTGQYYYRLYREECWGQLSSCSRSHGWRTEKQDMIAALLHNGVMTFLSYCYFQIFPGVSCERGSTFVPLAPEERKQTWGLPCWDSEGLGKTLWLPWLPENRTDYSARLYPPCPWRWDTAVKSR